MESINQQFLREERSAQLRTRQEQARALGLKSAEEVKDLQSRGYRVGILIEDAFKFNKSSEDSIFTQINDFSEAKASFEGDF